MEKTLCYHCFREVNPGDPVCGHCGHSTAEERDKYPHALPVGTVLGGRYITGQVLGQGGFGITYIAQDYRTKELVAIKEFFPDTMVTRNATHSAVPYSQRHREDFEYGKATFLEEAKTLAQFNGYPNIVGVKSYFEENGTAYFAMEYVEGVNLQSYVNSHGGKLTWQEAEQILLPVMDALSEVHAKGIIHRDIKPDNLCINSAGQLKVLDFGSARYSMGEKSRSLDVVLTPGFAPKEQYSRHGRQGAYTDVYALAATMYYAITGRKPPDSIDRTDEDELVPPTTLGVRISAEQEDALLKGLAVSPIDRFQTMAEFRQAIRGDSGGTVTPAAPEPPQPPETPEPPAPSVNPEPKFRLDKLPKWLIPAAVVAVVLIIVLAVSLGGGDNTASYDDGDNFVAASTETPIADDGMKAVSLMTKSTHYHDDGSIDFYTESEYNQYGEELRWNVYTPDGTLDYYWEFSYDDSGNMTGEWHFDDDGSLIYWYEYTYDGLGNMLSTHTYSDGDSLANWSEYIYNDQGYKTKETNYNEDGSIDHWLAFEYDAKGHLISTTYYLDSGAVNYYYEYKNDADGNPVEEHKYDGDNSLKRREECTYDAQGHLTLSKVYNGSSELTDTLRYEYDYDANGNKLKQTYYSNDTLKVVTEFAVTRVMVHGAETSVAPVDPIMEITPAASQAPIPVGDVTITLPGEELEVPDVGTETVSLKTKATYYNEDGTVDYYSEYEYNEYGEEIRWNRFEPDGTLKYYYEYVFDEEGNEIGEYDCEPDGTIDNWYERTYDHMGNVLTSYYYDSEGNVKWWFEYTYDDQGNQIKMVCYDPGAIVDYWYERVYDENGNEIRETKYFSDGSIDYVNERTYDENGNNIRFDWYTGDGSVDYWHAYDYDENGNQRLSVTYDADGYEEDRWEYTFDAHGNKTSTTYFPDGSAMPSYTSRYEYGYDIDGNMLKETYYYKDNLDTVTEYTVTQVLVRGNAS